MNADEFWFLIDEAKSKSSKVADIPKLVEKQLFEPELEQIADFAAWLTTYLNLAHDRRLLLAASIICGMISDDSFTYFKCWLIAQGRSTFERALRNPDSLAELSSFSGQNGELPLLENLLYVATKPFTEKSNGYSPGELELALPHWKAPVGTRLGRVPMASGDFWDGDKRKLEVLFPMLLQRFPQDK